jgi:lysophospholipase L1-like esterase
MREASDTIREQAAARGVLCLDAWSMPAAADPDLFGPDRIHPNASGHQVMAALCADLLTPGFSRDYRAPDRWRLGCLGCPVT